MEEQHDYIHFTSVDESVIYLRNNPHIVISHMCCGGKGYAIRRVSSPTDKVKSKSNSKPHNTSQGTCDICFLEEVVLHYTCTSCKQPFCMDCLQKLPKKICPCCRSPLC